MTKIIPSSLAAGFCIGLGGAVFLLQTEKLVGAGAVLPGPVHHL